MKVKDKKRNCLKRHKRHMKKNKKKTEFEDNATQLRRSHGYQRANLGVT